MIYAQPAATGAPRWIVYGRITDPAAATLDLSEAAGVPFRVPLRNGGFFIADVPRERWNVLGGTAGVEKILSSSGTVLRSGCVDWGTSPLSPTADTNATGFGGGDGIEPCTPRKTEAFSVDLNHAEKLFELTLTANFDGWKAGDRIAFWQAPEGNGKWCAFPGPTSAPAALYASGNDCRTKSTPILFGSVFEIGFSGAVNGNKAALWTVQGRTTSDVARMELRSRAGTIDVPAGHGYYFVQLPGTSASVGEELPDEGPYTLVAFDRDGRELKSIDLGEFRKAQEAELAKLLHG